MNEEVRELIFDRWAVLCDRNSFIGGDEVERFEQRWASYCGMTSAVGVANGTDALELALRALGIGAGDEVIVPANTFVATAEAVVHAGASPRFVDVDPDTLLLDAESVTASIGPATAAVIAVHLYGQPADMSTLEHLCRAKGLALIEDAAQAHGARWDGRAVGGLGDVAAFSFYPGKNLGAMGDAGAVVTRDQAIAERIRSMANHGRAARDAAAHERLGRNSRLDPLQAVVLDVKLDHLDRWNAARRRAAAAYARSLPADIEPVRVDQRAEAVHHLQVVRTRERDRVREALRARGIGTGIHYPVPCHSLAFFEAGSGERLTVAESAAGEILSLPMYPHLTLADIEHVCEALASERSAA
jgi:dTDP-4-amino-4,6-dideoxygalactose transaminase